jgi:cytochrome oxidase assembly protein ShyY1
MSRGRLIFVGCTTAALLVLAGWQLQREWQIKDCLETCGVWDGRTCGPLKVRPILQRDLRRS